MYALFREAVSCMTALQFLKEILYPPRAEVKHLSHPSHGCTKCGVQSFLQRDFDVCPHCLEWEHEGEDGRID